MEQLKKAIRKNVAGRRITDQFYVDGDVNVPDAKSDIGRVVYSRGTLRVDDMKTVDNYIRVTGKILYQILYVLESEEQRMSALQGKIPFEEMVYAEEEPKGSLLFQVWCPASAATLPQAVYFLSFLWYLTRQTLL